MNFTSSSCKENANGPVLQLTHNSLSPTSHLPLFILILCCSPNIGDMLLLKAFLKHFFTFNLKKTKFQPVFTGGVRTNLIKHHIIMNHRTIISFHSSGERKLWNQTNLRQKPSAEPVSAHETSELLKGSRWSCHVPVTSKKEELRGA